MSGKSQKNKSKQKTETLIYCGPTLKGLPAFSVYKSQPPKHVEEHIKKSPAVRELMVNSKDLKQVKHNLTVPGTREYQFYKSILKYAEGGTE